MYEKCKKTKIEFIENGLAKVKQLTIFIYLAGMLGLFPLYYKEQYYQIGDAKFEFFWKMSLGFLAITVVYVIGDMILKWIMQRSRKKINVLSKNNDLKKEGYLSKQVDIFRKLSNLDFTVLIYAICVVLSYCFSDFKEFALKGAPGWEMGLCSQLIFVAIYFILSRQNLFQITCFSNPKFSKDNKVTVQRIFAILVLEIHLAASALTFVFGILHRFDVDPLGMYEGLELYQKIEFLSTIGQATWFSGYVCTVFAIVDKNSIF